MTFNAKNLHYEKQEPAFLRRLRSENTSDRHNISIARPRKPRLEVGDEDGPTIVDEQGEEVTEKEYQDLLLGKTKNASRPEDTAALAKPDSNSDTERPASDSTANRAQEQEKRPVTSGGGLKKRKQGKAVATEPEPEPGPEDSGLVNGLPDTKKDDDSKAKMKSRKKKIKLSFDEPGT
ncbi:hypothetical protein EPUS_06098 [Endocarpon pusillum Z07020]|uniref:DUF4604 domain-containing protein n=1 Tax=Endocarpon pusillum (strain Z07020 / HMAS-L-300199) TaxID=1263415 RepID=U1G4T9_ENDPU|nr:uncharacterized protein EPUS_06098 [Endocarpon pusillum Z07020]ERF72342.1 hypothetical protein EPUS_06098 [Endocarpon pusillum Z07020]